MRPFYATAFALYRIYESQPAIDDDYGYAESQADALTRGVDTSNRLHLACRFDYPSAAGDPPWRALEKENTFSHEIGGHGLKDYLTHYAPGIAWGELYWQMRGFPGTYAQAAAAINPPHLYIWDRDPNESWAEAGGAALSGRWSKPEKTYAFGLPPPDPAALRAFFVQCVFVARPNLRPPTIPGVTWLPSPNYGKGGVIGIAGRTKPIRYIVMHTTEGTDSRGWLTSAESSVSCHYLEREDDEYQLVRDEDTAFCAGRIVGTPTTPLYLGGNPNDESINIEAEMFARDDITLRPITFNRVLGRIRNLRLKFGPLPLIGHFELSPGDRSDPGVANLAAIKAALGDEDEMTDADWQRLDKLIEDKIVASEGRILKAVKDYNPLIQVGRRIIRTLRKTGDIALVRDPGTAYPDDTSPIT